VYRVRCSGFDPSPAPRRTGFVCRLPCAVASLGLPFSGRSVAKAQIITLSTTNNALVNQCLFTRAGTQNNPARLKLTQVAQPEQRRGQRLAVVVPKSADHRHRGPLIDRLVCRSQWMLRTRRLKLSQQTRPASTFWIPVNSGFPVLAARWVSRFPNKFQVHSLA
jgi:hypothetical protein